MARNDKRRLVEIFGELVHETSPGEEDRGAYLIETSTGDEVWLPKSQTQDNHDGTFTIPIWLADEKGLEVL